MEGELKQTDTERARQKTAKKITAGIMNVLRFWKLCKKKKQKEYKEKSTNTK